MKGKVGKSNMPDRNQTKISNFLIGATKQAKLSSLKNPVRTKLSSKYKSKTGVTPEEICIDSCQDTSGNSDDEVSIISDSPEKSQKGPSEPQYHSETNVSCSSLASTRVEKQNEFFQNINDYSRKKLFKNNITKNDSSKCSPSPSVILIDDQLNTPCTKTLSLQTSDNSFSDVIEIPETPECQIKKQPIISKLLFDHKKIENTLGKSLFRSNLPKHDSCSFTKLKQMPSPSAKNAECKFITSKRPFEEGHPKNKKLKSAQRTLLYKNSNKPLQSSSRSCAQSKNTTDVANKGHISKYFEGKSCNLPFQSKCGFVGDGVVLDEKQIKKEIDDNLSPTNIEDATEHSNISFPISFTKHEGTSQTETTNRLCSNSLTSDEIPPSNLSCLYKKSVNEASEVLCSNNKGTASVSNTETIYTSTNKPLIDSLDINNCVVTVSDNYSSRSSGVKTDDTELFTQDIEMNDDIETWLSLNEKFSPVKCETSDKNSNNLQSSSEVQQDGSSISWKVTKVERNVGELLLSLSAKESIATCSLQGFWAQTLIAEEDVVHVLSPFINNHAVVNDSSGFIIVTPDLLMSSTAIVSSLFCMRKAVLAEIFRGWDGGNFSMILGNIIHQLFQEAVQKKVVSEDSLQSMLKNLISRSDHLLSMYGLDASDTEMLNESSNYIPSIKNWISQYMLPVSSLTSHDLPKDEIIQVSEVKDIEDNIWSPKLGIKGKIDLTLEVTIHNRKSASKKVLPLELKTGKPTFSAEHTGQVSLYTMMMEDYFESTDEGLLLYLKNEPQMKRVAAKYNLQRGLIQLRNELAYYLKKTASICKSQSDEKNGFTKLNYMPAPINSTRACHKCPYLLPCTVYQKAVENYTPDSHDHVMLSLVPKETEHLLSSHLTYFKHWCQLLHQEAAASTLEKSFWNENSWNREKKGLCFSKMVLISTSPIQQETANISYCHMFKRLPGHVNSNNLIAVGLSPSDYVVISREGNQGIGITSGFMVSISDTSVEIALDRDLCTKPNWKDITYRIDKYSMSNTAMASSYKNITHLMAQDAIATHLRKLIIDKESPSFLKTLGREVITKGRSILKPLNKPQQRAIFKVLMSQDYILLKGMPGTGKTSTIVALVRLLVHLKKSILLTSYTHSAVDNILLKLKQYDVDFLRLGQLARIHLDLKQFSFEAQTKSITSIKDLKAFLSTKLVIAATCLGANHPVLRFRQFDICIVDESCQILQTACLGPLFCAKKFVLVGDPKQLPPLVQSITARESGMLESLFSRLETPENTMELNLQYRMNREIMNLCNEVTYNGALQCGTEEVATGTLKLPTVNEVVSKLPHDSWLRVALAEDLSQSVLFFDTDEMSAVQGDSLRKVVNILEVELAVQLAYSLKLSGLKECDIGIISPYRKQVHLLKKSLKELNLLHIEANTVDQYQGRDKQAIIISCVRQSKDDAKVGDILSDERRLTVAISRPKHKLIFIGSFSSLLAYEPFQKLLNALNSKQIHKLPPNANLFQGRKFFS